MAELVNKTLDVVGALPLQSLEEDWVKSCWDNHFLDVNPLPLVTENLLQSEGYFVQHLERLRDVADEWQKVQSDTEGLWTSLLENNVSHKALVALLAYLIPMGHDPKACRGQKKEAAFAGATAYLSLIGLPGSRAFKVYSPDLLLRAVDLLKFDSGFASTGTQKRGAQAVSSSQRSQPQAKKKSRSSARQTPSQDFFNDDDEDENDEDADDDEDLAPSRVQRFRCLYINLMTELVSLLETFSLRESLLTAEHVLKVLAALTRLDNYNFDGCFPIVAPSGRHSQRLGVAGMAFKGILLICQPLHGDVKTLTTSTCKYMLPNILMLLDGNKVCAAQTMPKNLQLGRDHAITFIKYILKNIGEPCLVSTKILLQHMCMRVPDRTEYRNKAAQAVVTILEDFPDEQFAFMLKWIGVLSRNEKSTVRVMALELITLLLAMPERQLRGITEEEETLASHTVLINQLLARCSDVTAAVRTRAITGFAQCMESGGVSVKKTIQEMITPRSDAPHPPRLVPTPNDVARTAQQTDRTVDESKEDEETGNDQSGATRNGEKGDQGDATPVTPAAQTPGADNQQTPFRSVEVSEALDNSLPDRQGVISMLHKRAREEKVFVRKAALQALQKFILFEASSVHKEDMELLCERCRDSALSVRKQALVSLTDVLTYFQNNRDVQSAWLKGALPRVWDQETSIQEKCLEIVDTVLLSNIAPFHRSKTEDHVMTWQLLTLISKPENADLRRHFKKVCRLWERQKKLKGPLISSIFSHVGTDNNQAAWSLLADIATTKVTVDMKPVVQYWKDNNQAITGETEGDVWENVLRIICFNAQSLSSEQRSRLKEEFKAYLLRFVLKPVLISALATAVHQLNKADSGENARSAQEWGRDILTACDRYLSAIVLDEDMSGDGSYDEDSMMCYLYTLGVVALLCPSITPKRVLILVQSFIAAPCISAAGDPPDSLSSGSQAFHTSHESQGSSVSDEGSQGTQSSQTTQGSQCTQPVSQFRGCKMSDPVRAVAFLTLGKLCLQEKSVAKKCVPAMARELETSTCDAVRNNIVIILRDLCISYATLVDPYVSVMATCLRDPAPIVRRQTLELLTGLLQEDFLKWKGSLFFRFILTLLDPHPEISAFAEYCLGFHLLKRHPTMMSQHLLESIFVFNDYDKHNVFNKYTQSDRERELFSLKGKDNFGQRMKLYQFMMEHMEDEHRFQLTAKISQEVLGAVVDGILLYDEDSCQLLQDALAILSSKEIKLSSLRSTKSMDDAADEMEMANAVIATAKKTLITQVVKKNVMENVIPLVLSLKHMLDKERSPLLKDLMAFLRELMKDFKNEIKDILAADKQLACEVEYDLRMFENQQTDSAEQEQATPTTAPVQVAIGPVSSPLPSKPSTPAAGSTRKGTPAAAGSVRGNTPVTAQQGSIIAGGTPKPQSWTDTRAGVQQTLRRTVEQQGRRASTAGQDRRRLSSVKWAEDVVSNLSSPASASGQESEGPEKPQTPQRQKTAQQQQQQRKAQQGQKTPQQPRRPLRAISTPSGLLSNVTFAEESNMTMPLIPPSPIPGQSKCHHADVTGEDENDDVHIVFVELPKAGKTKPREWQVKVKTEVESEEAALPAVVSSPVVSRSRRNRRVQSPSS